MASRPTPHSMALAALIALHSERESPLYVDCDASVPAQVDGFLQRTLTDIQGGGSSTSTNSTHPSNNTIANSSNKALPAWARLRAPPIRPLIEGLRAATPTCPQVATRFAEWLLVASGSIDAMLDLMTSVRQTIPNGLVDPSSWCGAFVRSVSLGFEELSFEATSRLWQEWRRRVQQIEENSGDDGDDTATDAQLWRLSSAQREAALRRACLDDNNDKDHAENDHEQIKRGLAAVLEENPALPSAHFLRFLTCLRSRERAGATEALHQYFDYALMQAQAQQQQQLSAENNNADRAATGGGGLLQFAPVLLALQHHQAGDEAMARLAADEAVRVAQQSQDGACVAFALGWLYENDSSMAPRSGNAEDAGQLLRRCSERAISGNLRSLAAGAHLSQVRHSLTAGRNRDRRQTGHSAAAAAWNQLYAAATDAPAAESAAAASDLATHMTSLDNGNEALRILARQRLVASAVWEAFGQTASAGLASFISVYCQAEHLLPEHVTTAVQNIARASLFGSNRSAAVLSPEALKGGALYQYADLVDSALGGSEGSGGRANNEERAICMYGETLYKLLRLRQAFSLPLQGVFIHEIALVLHEWAVRRGDLEDAASLLTLLQSHLHPGMANVTQARIDVYAQKALLLGKQGRVDEAKRILKAQIETCQKAGLWEQQARLLLQLATMQLGTTANDQFTGTLPCLLECLTLCDKYEMQGLHAAAISVMAQLHLRMHRPKQAIAVLNGALPTLLQQEHQWFQAEAFLTLSKCHLKRAKQVEQQGNSTVPASILEVAIKDLARSEDLFRRCQDGEKLQEIYYLQARLYDWKGQSSERDEAATQFLTISKHLSQTMAPNAKSGRGFLSALSSDEALEALAVRSYP